MKNIMYEIEKGIDICSRPYLRMAEKLGLSEFEIVELLKTQIQERNIRRFGPIVKHQEFGYRQNAMIVWLVDLTNVEQIAQQILNFPFVTLCYQRKTVPGIWPFSLYCMVHAKNEIELNEYLKLFNENEVLKRIPNEILVSHRCFKQKGARYRPVNENWREQLLTRLQKGIKCESQPFQLIADELDLHESEVMAQIQVWLADGTLTRFGPMFNIEKMGGEFTLVAMEVPVEKFEHVTEQVNEFTEVAHNYEREHRLNMWFVLACESAEHTKKTISAIEQVTQIKCYALPKEKEFYLNLQLEAR